MSNTDNNIKKIITIDRRKFFVNILKFTNGCFVSISENNEKIGAMMASTTITTTTTITIIPAKNNHFFLRLLSEKISSAIAGVSIVSLYVLTTIDTKICKDLLNYITKTIQND